MTSRREFLHHAVAVSAAAAICPSSSRCAASALEQHSWSNVDAVLVDRRFLASATVAEAAQQAGIAVHAAGDDISALWYELLASRWAEGTLSLAGFTGAGTLFVLEQLAWPAGMRVTYRAEHWRLGERLVRHETTGTPSIACTARRLPLRPGEWERPAADLLLRSRHQRPRAARDIDRAFLIQPAPHTELEGVSWNIGRVASTPLFSSTSRRTPS